MKPWICVSIQSKTTDQTVEAVKAVTGADLIEIRLDHREKELDLTRIVEASKVPLIGTNRREDQGGKAIESEEERIKILVDAVRTGFHYIDLASTTENLGEVVKTLQDMGVKVIASHHDFEHPFTIEELEEKHDVLSSSGCDIVKIIGWANGIIDNIPYLAYNRKHPGNVSFGMGAYGVTSRIMAPLAGALYTYASQGEGKELAPGQVPVTHLREIYRSIRQ